MKARQVAVKQTKGQVKQTKGQVKTTNDDKKTKTWQIILVVIEVFFYIKFVYSFLNMLNNLLDAIGEKGWFVVSTGVKLFTEETRALILAELKPLGLNNLADAISKNTITVGQSVNYIIQSTSTILGDLAIALIARKIRCSYKSIGDSGLQSTRNNPGQWTCFK